MRYQALPTFAAVCCVALTSCGSAGGSGGDSDQTRLEAAYAKCTDSKNAPDTIEGQKVGDALEIADEGETLIIETTGENDMAGLVDYVCVVEELGTSERVQSSIENTTSMMGRQSAEDDGLTYEFTYHPDNGLYVLIADGQS